MKSIAMIGAATLALVGGLAEARVNMARVAPGKAAIVMHARHEGMESVGKTMKQLLRAVKSDPVDMGAVRSNAAAMNALAQRSTNWFMAGTGPEAGKTGAKPEIWQKPQDFAAKAAAWQSAAAAFDAAARSGNQAAVQARFAALGNSCKACHDSYRMDMHH